MARMSGSSIMRCRSARRASSAPARYAWRAPTESPSMTRSPQPSSTRTPASSRASSTAPDGAITPTTSPGRSLRGCAIATDCNCFADTGFAPSSQTCKSIGHRLNDGPMRPPAAQRERRVARLSHGLRTGLRDERLGGVRSQRLFLAEPNGVLAGGVSLDEGLDQLARARMPERVVPGSREWDVLSRRYYEEERRKL